MFHNYKNVNCLYPAAEFDEDISAWTKSAVFAELGMFWLALWFCPFSFFVHVQDRIWVGFPPELGFCQIFGMPNAQFTLPLLPFCLNATTALKCTSAKWIGPSALSQCVPTGYSTKVDKKLGKNLTVQNFNVIQIFLPWWLLLATFLKFSCFSQTAIYTKWCGKL